MMCPRSALPLSQLDVLAVDCQATTAAPRGHLLEIGRMRVRTAVTHARLITLPYGEHIQSTFRHPLRASPVYPSR
jgi:hypothetical protein